MRIILTIVLTIIATSALTAQPEPKKHDELKRQAKQNSQSLKYDKFDDVTSIIGSIYDLITLRDILGNVFVSDNQIRALKFTSALTFNGNELTESNGKYYLLFVSQSERFLFSRNANLIIIADSERLRFTPSEMNIGVSNYIGEELAFSMTRDDLSKFADAKVLELKLGDFTKKLNSRHQKVLRQTLTMGDLAIRAEKK